LYTQLFTAITQGAAPPLTRVIALTISKLNIITADTKQFVGLLKGLLNFVGGAPGTPKASVPSKITALDVCFIFLLLFFFVVVIEKVALVM
jgi:hypothetical protein